MSTFNHESFHQHAAAALTDGQIPGMAVAIAQQGAPLFVEGFGWRDREAQLPVTPETLFGIASVTKSFAALAIMQLQEAGRLRVDQPLTHWLPEFRGPNPDWISQIQLHHLMTHTSGLPGMQALFHARAASVAQDPNRHRLQLVTDPTQVRQIKTYQELIALMAETDYSLLGRPGTHFNYSNEGYALLQGVIERASDQPFLTYMQEKILDPIGMRRSTFLTADLAHLAPVTELYAPVVESGRLEILHAPGWWDVGEIYTNGSLKSTVLDLIRYLEIYRNGGRSGDVQLLSAAGIDQMTYPHATLPTGRQYGYGLDVQTDYHGQTLIGHGGSIKGVSAHVMVAKEAGITSVVLCNRTGASADQIALAGINAGLGLPLTAPRREYPSFAITDLQPYVGEYRNQEGSYVRIEESGGRLQLSSGGLPLPLRPYDEDSFVIVPTNAPIRFLRDEMEQVSSLFMGVRLIPRQR